MDKNLEQNLRLWLITIPCLFNLFNKFQIKDTLLNLGQINSQNHGFLADCDYKLREPKLDLRY